MTEEQIQLSFKLNTEKQKVEDQGVVHNRCSTCKQIINLEDAVTASDCPDNAYCSQKCAVAGEL